MKNQAPHPEVVPPGYVVIREGNQTRVVKTELERHLRSLMTKPFEELAGLEHAQRIATGRAGPITLAVPGPAGRVFIRPYAHGGLLGPLRGKTFSGPARAYNELNVCHVATSLNLPVPALIGLTTRRISPKKWRMEAWSWWIRGASPLSVYLKDMELGSSMRCELMRDVAAAVKRCHDAGLVHGDLNARNIIVVPPSETEQTDLPRSHTIRIIDLDKAELVASLSDKIRQSQIRRLFRSLVKERVVPEHLTQGEFAVFIRAYFGDAITEIQLDNFLTSCVREAFWHSRITFLLRRKVSHAEKSPKNAEPDG